jgi:hypothetical protein
MYLDILGLVTCAVGILIDPISLAMPLPWKRDSDGERATPDQVRAAWHALKDRQDLKKRHVSHARALTGLHLDDADIDAIVAKKLESNAAHLAKKHFPLFEEFPADAQLGLLSMAWAVGPDFPVKFPTFTGHAKRQQWESAIHHCTIREAGNPGVVPRNRANRVCFANAEIVNRCGLARDILRWPNVAQAETVPSERAANLGTLVVSALEDARVYADEAAQRARERMFDASEMSADPADEPTKKAGLGGRGIA